MIYEGEGKEENIFGTDFVERNKDNIDLIIEGRRINLIERYKLKKGENNIKMIIKKEISYLGYMFDDCKSLKNIDELKYLNTKNCFNFGFMFNKCQLLKDIKSLEN